MEAALLDSIKGVILKCRQRFFRIANSALLETYWSIGQLIMEDEQKGKKRAKYSSGTLRELSKSLTLQFGKGYDESNLWNIRAFYIASSILDALRQELNWRPIKWKICSARVSLIFFI